MRRFILIIAICTGVLWGGPVGCDEADEAVFDRAIAAYKRGDYAEAVKWFRKAAEQGHGSAQYNLGLAYMEGKGVPEDYVRAHMWFNLVAAQDNRAMAKLLRDSVAKFMTPAQIAEAQKLAAEWRPKK